MVETPEITLESDLFDTVEPWYAVRVHGRREEAFAAKMRTAGVPCFVPTEVVIRRERRREPGRRHEHKRIKVRVPLWQGYCFIGADGNGIYAAKATNLVYKIIPAVNQDRLVSALRMLKNYMDAQPDAVRSRTIAEGTRCEVRPGHVFAGKVGTWARDEKGKLCLKADGLFGRDGTPLHIDVEFLEPL